MNEVSYRRRHLVGIIPFYGIDTRFWDRMVRWAEFVTGNKLREIFHTSLVVPIQYSAYLDKSIRSAFETIKTVEGAEYNAMTNGHCSVSDYLSGVVNHADTIACFLFAGNDPVIRMAYPEALALHFEAGLLSRGSLPNLFQYDPIGLYEHGALNELGSLKLSEASELLCKFVFNSAGKTIVSIANRVERIMTEDLKSYIDKFERIAILALPKNGDGNIEKFVGQRISFQELVRRFIAVMPSSVGIIATMHPAEEFQCIDDDFIFANQDRVRFVATGEHLVSSDFFSIADTIIVINSMAGAQAKLVGLQMVCSENHPLRSLSDSVFRVTHNSVEIIDNVITSDIDAVIGYVLSYLHLPLSIWNTGYGRAYIDHFLRGGTVSTLHEDRVCFQNIEKVRKYYEAYLV